MRGEPRRSQDTRQGFPSRGTCVIGHCCRSAGKWRGRSGVGDGDGEFAAVGAPELGARGVVGALDAAVDPRKAGREDEEGPGSRGRRTRRTGWCGGEVPLGIKLHGSAYLLIVENQGCPNRCPDPVHARRPGCRRGWAAGSPSDKTSQSLQGSGRLTCV